MKLETAFDLRRYGRKAVIGLVSLAFAATCFVPITAHSRSLPLVRDSETESLLRDYSAPIFKAAGFSSKFVAIHLINSNDFNAFVANGRRMYINLGTLKQAETPNEVIGVIAHEAGHIAGGHLARLRRAAAGARATAIFSQILAGAAIIAGAATRNESVSNSGVGILQGGQTLALRNLLAHQRSEESAADRAAITYLERTGQSGLGMLKTFERLQRQIPISSRFIDPYTISHPLPRDRITAIERLVKGSKYQNRKDSDRLIARHELMQAKLAAFTEHPKRVARQYPKKDKSLAADYARAIVAYRFGNIRAAQRSIDKLIKRAPSYPYFWELKGQAYLESGKPKEAVVPLRKALKLKPGAPLMLSMLGHALVASNDKSKLSEAVKVLNAALLRDKTIGRAYQQLAIAYGRLDQRANASLATANGLFFFGDYQGAKFHATRAKKLFKRGTRGWLQADDILTFRPPRLKK